MHTAAARGSVRPQLVELETQPSSQRAGEDYWARQQPTEAEQKRILGKKSEGRNGKVRRVWTEPQRSQNPSHLKPHFSPLDENTGYF